MAALTYWESNKFRTEFLTFFYLHFPSPLVEFLLLQSPFCTQWSTFLLIPISNVLKRSEYKITFHIFEIVQSMKLFELCKGFVLFWTWIEWFCALKAAFSSLWPSIPVFAALWSVVTYSEIPPAEKLLLEKASALGSFFSHRDGQGPPS